MNYMIMPFRRYFDFQGRSRRMEFWMFFLLNFIISLVFTVVFIALFLGKLVELARRYGTYTYDSFSSGSFSYDSAWSLYVPPEILLQEIGPLGIAMVVVLCVYSLLIIIPGLAVTIRRLHDSDRSGWWVLLPYAFYFMTAFATVLAFTAPLTWLWVAIASLSGIAAGVGALVLLVFMLLEGTRGPNRFGASPKGPDVGTTFG